MYAFLLLLLLCSVFECYVFLWLAFSCRLFFTKLFVNFIRTLLHALEVHITNFQTDKLMNIYLQINKISIVDKFVRTFPFSLVLQVYIPPFHYSKYLSLLKRRSKREENIYTKCVRDDEHETSITIIIGPER